MAVIDVVSRPTAAGWTCEVAVRDGVSETHHTVAVSRHDLERFAPAEPGPDRLVRCSFEFLLEREPKESILRSFDLPVILRYFPEYEHEIRARLRT
jgi:hypothetical protein